MKLRVEASLTDDDPAGSVVVGFYREEIVILTDEAAPELALAVGQKLLDWLEEAKTSVGAQTEAAQKNVDRLKRENGL